MLWNQTNTHILRFHGWGDVSADPRLSSCISLLWLRHVESGHQSVCVLHLTGPRPWTSCPYCALVKDNQISYSNKPRLDFLGIYVRKRRKNSSPCSRRRTCLFMPATLTKMLLERHRDRLDLVCLHVTTSNIRVLVFVFSRDSRVNLCTLSPMWGMQTSRCLHVSRWPELPWFQNLEFAVLCGNTLSRCSTSDVTSLSTWITLMYPTRRLH